MSDNNRETPSIHATKLAASIEIVRVLNTSGLDGYQMVDVLLFLAVGQAKHSRLVFDDLHVIAESFWRNTTDPYATPPKKLENN